MSTARSEFVNKVFLRFVPSGPMNGKIFLYRSPLRIFAAADLSDIPDFENGGSMELLLSYGDEPAGKATISWKPLSKSGNILYADAWISELEKTMGFSDTEYKHIIFSALLYRGWQYREYRGDPDDKNLREFRMWARRKAGFKD